MIESPADEPQMIESPADEPQMIESPADEPQMIESPADEPQMMEVPASQRIFLPEVARVRPLFERLLVKDATSLGVAESMKNPLATASSPAIVVVGIWFVS